MDKKKNSKKKYYYTDKKKPKQSYKTVELKNFVNEIKNVNREVSKDISKSDTDNGNGGVYLGFGSRFAIIIIELIAAIVVFGYSLFASFSVVKEELINYKVSSDIDYKVCLKANDFYDTKCLDKGMAYVASLIDKININYNYKFVISKDSNIDFDYKVIAKLVIANKSNSNVFFDKEYVLKDSKQENMTNDKMHVIEEETTINYSYYNNLANKFRSKYAVDTNSYLDVYLLVNEKDAEGNYFKLNNDSKAILTIPLSMQEINIALNKADINESNQVLAHSKIIIKSIGNVIISCLLFIIIIVLIVRLFKKLMLLTGKKSEYDIFVNRILKGYDRIIVNIKSVPSFEGYNMIKVESFQELVDVRDNYKAPINYYVVSEHQKCEFFIINNNDVYIYVVKAIDLEKGN